MPSLATTRTLKASAVLILGFGTPIAVLSASNRLLGEAANLVTARAGSGLSLTSVAAAIANPALAVADADAMFRYLLLNPARPLGDERLLLFLGLPGGIVILALLWSRLPRRAAEQVALAALGASVCCLLLIWTVSGSVSLEARHVASGSIAALPLLLERGIAVARASRRVVRGVLAVSGCGFVLAPLAYGFVAVPGKVFRDSATLPGPSGVRNEALSADASACRAELVRGTDLRRDVWYVTDVITALDAGDRVIAESTDFIDPDTLRHRVYHSSAPVRVHLLILPALDEQGKGAIVRASFRGAQQWTKVAPAGCVMVRWDAQILPDLP